MSEETFAAALENRILLFDGAMGTEIQRYQPTSEDFPDGKDGFNDGLSITKPDWIKEIHRKYLTAGADCIETNTFGSNKIKLDEYGFGAQTVELNQKNAELARSVCNEFTDRQRFVVGSMGPTGYLPSSNDADLGQMPLSQIREAFELQAEGLIKGTADALLIETSQDILEVKLAVEASHTAMEKTGINVTLISNVTLDQYGKMLLGTNVQSAYTTISDMGIDIFGLNCSTGPIEMEPSIQWLNDQKHKPLLIVPNAGMPENVGGQAVYKMTPEKMASALNSFIEEYPQISIIGGCCGTNPEHIAQLRKTIDQQKKD